MTSLATAEVMTREGTDVDQQSTDQLMIVDSQNACHFPAG